MRGGSVGMGGGGGVAERYEWKASASQRHSSATLAQNATTFMAASNRFSIYDKTLFYWFAAFSREFKSSSSEIAYGYD